MSSLKELLEQQAELSRKIDQVRRQEQGEAVAKARQLIAEFGLTVQQVFPKNGERASTKGTKVAPKYRDPVSGGTWTGRGKPPAWIAGKDRESFVIA